MEYHKVSNTDLYISRIILGCHAFAGGDCWGAQSDDDSIGTVCSALDLGINSFDTTPYYANGRAEKVLGMALKGRRDEAYIFSRAGKNAVDAQSLIDDCTASLRRLKTDRIDFLQIDRANTSIRIEELISGLRGLQKRGMIREFGLSNVSSRDLSECEGAAFAHLPYSLVCREIEHETLNACVDSEVSTIAFGALQHGLLAGKYSTLGELPLGRRKSLGIDSRSIESVDRLAINELAFSEIKARLESISNACGIKVVHLALGWVLSRPNIDSVVVGARLPHQIVENVSVLDHQFAFDVLNELGTISLKVNFANRLAASVFQADFSVGAGFQVG